MVSQVDHKRVLVTGGAGFIGSNLVEDLLTRDNDVVVLDNFSTGFRANLEACLDNPRFSLIEGDIRDPESCQKALSGVDLVFHEAALGSVPRSIADPVLTADVNIRGFVTMLHEAVKAGIKRFVYAASSSTYGDLEESPKVEERIGKPLSPYAITKYVDELYAANFHDLYGIDCIGLRYFNVFGRRQSPAGAYAAVIPRFAQALLRHESPVIFGDGSVSRDFTYIDNVLLANNLAGTAEDSQALNQVYNVACGGSLSVGHLFELLRKDLAAFDGAISQIPAEYGPARRGDIPRSLASIEKGRRLLGYEPSICAERGLELSARWYYDHLSR